MRLKLFNLFSTSVTTLGVLASPVSAFSYEPEVQTDTIQIMIQEGTTKSIRENDIQKIHQQETVESIQPFSVAIYPRTTQPSQANTTSQIDWSAVFINLIPITSVIVSIVLIDLWYRRYQKQHDQRAAEIEQIFSERKKQIEILERIWRMKP
ncbi:hypothetical protein F7734_19720 [Scytonema sp. UIC 10036]|uniref:hypothetical protein n=1 Tax=Scytonema sp. UIC 10036 TaxID=2304196 RepID=UPI0012DA29A8|nr:hypothetical protein [Scytonema sp. UIC 10036]MUG94485.1 hypothetical protein [Scytonema sp. UIC 10036]